MELNKAEVAAHLEVSERTVERLVTSGRLAVARYERGGRRPAPFFDAEDVELLKNELHAAPIRATKPTNDVNDETGRNAKGDSDNSDSDITGTGAIVLAPQDPATFFTQLVEAAVAAGVQAAEATIATRDKATPDLSGLSVKLTLSIDEAALLAGVSRGIIRAAIQEGTLPARIVGRGYRVGRSALETWTETLLSDKPTQTTKVVKAKK